MDTSGIIKILIFGFWVPVSILGIAYIYWRLFMQRRINADTYRAKRMSEEMIYETKREIQRITEMLPKIIESTTEDIQMRLVTKIENVFNEKIKNIAKDLQLQFTTSDKLPNQEKDRSSTLVRELSHTLHTPLSQIEAATLSLISQSSNGKTINSGLSKSLDSIQTSLNICKSVLAAYRELVLMVRSSTTWSPTSLAQALTSAANLYINNVKKKLTFKVNMPDEIHGYSNNYVVAILLPIIENAVEAGRNGSEISILGKDNNDNYLIEVTNVTDSPIKSTDIYKDGFSTKPGHLGSGLTIVKHLLTAYSGSSISHKMDNSIVTFYVKLPIGK